MRMTSVINSHTEKQAFESINQCFQNSKCSNFYATQSDSIKQHGDKIKIFLNFQDIKMYFPCILCQKSW